MSSPTINPSLPTSDPSAPRPTAPHPSAPRPPPPPSDAPGHQPDWDDGWEDLIDPD